MTIDEFNQLNPVHYLRPDACWCGQPNRLEDDHDCAECPDHCELSAHRDGRPSPRVTVGVTSSTCRDIAGARGRQSTRGLARNSA